MPFYRTLSIIVVLLAAPMAMAQTGKTGVMKKGTKTMEPKVGKPDTGKTAPLPKPQTKRMEPKPSTPPKAEPKTDQKKQPVKDPKITHHQKPLPTGSTKHSTRTPGGNTKPSGK